MTPLVRLRTLPRVWVKDEGASRLGSWADRRRASAGPGEVLANLRPGPMPADVLSEIMAEVRQQLGHEPDVVLHQESGLSAADAIDAGLSLLRDEGLLLPLVGVRCVEAARARSESCIVAINPYSGLLDVETYRRRFPALSVPETDKLGGLITPR